MFIADGVADEGEEWLTLEPFLPTPSALLTVPSGEGVFFRNVISLTILDSGGKYDIIII